MINFKEIEPKNVFRYFKKISSIPHGSGNTAQISDYFLAFAKKRNLKAVKDEAGNVIIYADGTKGYENSQTVILQAHMDMVCDKTPECNKDMDKEGIDLCYDEEFIWADGTTLGADDGIAVAYILALLDSDDIPHPPIEALLTNDEEVGMQGARAVDVSLLKGKRLINIDSEIEGVLTVSCAGGVRANCRLPLDYIKTENVADTSIEISIAGLKGGHSGIDINKHRRNASKVLARLLHYISKNSEIYVNDVAGGRKTNAIPQQAKAIISYKNADDENVHNSIKEFLSIIKKECATSEPNICIKTTRVNLPEQSATKKCTDKLIFTLLQIPDGLQRMSPDIPNLVQTSLNMGELSIKDNNLTMGIFIRSNASTGKQFLVEKLQSFIDYLDGYIEFKFDYPAWEYKSDSKLRKIMVKAYEDIYADEPTVSAIHAGLECGILSGKIPDADMVSFGPDLIDVHTPKEKLNIASAARSWEYLKKVLEKCK
jgi:dipeptidase D